MSEFFDFFWPTLKASSSSDLEPSFKISKEDCRFRDVAEIQLALEYAKEFARFEDERRQTVENKAALFIGAFSLAVSLLVSVVADLISKVEQYPVFIALIVIFTVLLIIYLCRASLYAVKALSRKNYYVIGVPKSLFNVDRPVSSEEQLTNLFIEITNNTYSNCKATNEKVDAMVMAQEFFKCAIRTVLVLAVLLFALLIYA